MRSSLPLLVLAVVLGAAPAAVRLDLGTVSTLGQEGWIKWTPPANDGFGPLAREFPATGFAPEGFRIVLGPTKALGCRSGKPTDDPRSALVMDSFFARAETPPILELAGLPTGEFRIVLWFNDARGYEWPPVTVSASDAKGPDRIVAKDVPQGSTGDSNQVGRADFAVFSDGHAPIRLATRVPLVPGQKQYVFLCAIEILDAASGQQASLPVPPDGTDGLPPGPVDLLWSPARDASAQRLLLGPSPTELVPVAENPEGNGWRAGPLGFGERRFWRVDATIEGRIVPGAVWQFAMASGQATHPVPRPDAPPVPCSTALRWRLPPTADRADLWLGTDPASLARVATDLVGEFLQPESLRRGTTYFWRVDPRHGRTAVTGEIWQFRVDAGGARHPSPGDGERDVPGDRMLRWVAGGADAVSALLVGDSPERLRPVEGAVANGHHRLPLRPGETVFWRVDETYGDETVAGPLWHFTVGSFLVIEDFETYTATHRLSDVWRDGRAIPGTEARVALSPDGRNALVLPAHGVAHRTFPSPRNWHGWMAGRLRARVSAPVELTIADAAGKEARLLLTPADGLATVPASSLAGIDLGSMAALSLRALAAVEIDDLMLVVEPDVPQPEPAIGELGSIRGAPVPPIAGESPERELTADVCVVGGGSGGIGAAVSAARAGARVLLVERNQILGGTSTAAYVINWEPGPGCSLAREIVDRLAAYPHGHIITRAKDYAGTLTRASNGRVGYEIEPFHEVAMAMLRETGCARVLLGTTFVRAAADRDQRRVRWIDVVRDGERCRIRARVFVDCTGSGFLCQAAGCEAMLGVDPRSRFDEPEAPEEPKDQLNAIELCYRIRKSPNPVRQVLPDGRKPRRGGAAWPLPSGDKFVNTCGGLGPGWLLMDRGYEEARKELELRVQQHWHWLQQEKYPDYEFDSYAPMLAIRESHRIVGEYVLRRQDLMVPVAESAHPDIVAVADHPMDTHGAGGGLGSVAAPYGIPYRCLVPKGPWRNLLVACRASSFSHLAASSCRLSRTMMAIGHAAGLAAAESARTGREVMEVDIPGLQAQLRMPPESGRGPAGTH